MLRLGAYEWEIFDIPNLLPRMFPVFEQIDNISICILGGRIDR